MKKILNVIVIVLLACTLTHAQQGWVNHKVDNKVSLKFPYPPKDLTPGTVVSISPDSSMVYIFTIVDFAKVAGLDSATLTPLETTPEFTAQLKGGIKQSLPNVDLSDFTIGTFNGFTSYTTSGSDAKKKRYDMFMFIIGTNFYSLSTVSKEGKSLDTRDKFFTSVTVTK